MRAVLVLSLLFALIAPAAVAAEEIAVEASSFFDVVEAGGFGEVTCAVENRTGSDLRVFLEGHLDFEGVGRTRVLGPTILEIPAGLRLEIAPLFLVPERAEPGPATFTCRAHVADRLEPPGPHRARRGEATADFEVE